MTEEQLETLNITQQVLRGTLLAVLATNPESAVRAAGALRGFAGDGRDLHPFAARMLLDLASGLDVISAARATKQ